MSRFVLPQVDFSPGEREVLAAAGRVWSAHAVGEESRHALAKLAAAGVELNAEPGSAFQPSLNATDPGFHELWRANSARQRVRFTYRNNNGEVRERDLEPWVMAQRGGAWYVMGFDRTRGDSRKFKLARIVSTPEPYGLTGAYDVPADLDTAALVAEISPEEGQERAVLAIRGDYAPSLRRSGEVTDHPATPDGYTAHAVTYGNDRAFSQTLAPFGSDVLVLEPLHLRATLIEHFERVIAAHSGGVDTERGLA